MIRLIKRTIIKVDWVLHNQNDLMWKIFVILGIAKSPTLESIMFFNGVGSKRYKKAIEELSRSDIWDEDL